MSANMEACLHCLQLQEIVNKKKRKIEIVRNQYTITFVFLNSTTTPQKGESRIL